MDPVSLFLPLRIPGRSSHRKEKESLVLLVLIVFLLNIVLNLWPRHPHTLQVRREHPLNCAWYYLPMVYLT
jgi:hypothetical protein